MDKIVEFVKNELANDFSGHDFHHALRVVNNAKRILKYEKADEQLVIAACYLHDCVDKKLFNDLDNQISKIKNILTDKFESEEINKIIEIITSISYNNGNFKELNTIEAKIVRDADRLDALGAFGIIRSIEYGNSKKRKFYDDNNLKEINGSYSFHKSSETTLSHFYDKLLKIDSLMHTRYAKKEARRRKKVLVKFLKEFYIELK